MSTYEYADDFGAIFETDDRPTVYELRCASCDARGIGSSANGSSVDLAWTCSRCRDADE